MMGFGDIVAVDVDALGCLLRSSLAPSAGNILAGARR